MAKIELGGIVSQISGSIGGTTFARNRYGTYARTKAIPVNPNTAYQQEIRAALAARSQEWRGLTDDQRQQWRTWAQVNPFMDVLGNSQILQPNAAYIRLNMLLAVAGDSVLTSPPITDAPDALLSLDIDADVLGPTCALTFAGTPLDTDDRLVVYAAVVNSVGITYVENLYKLIEISAKAQATGLDVITSIVERFGTLIEGQAVHIRARVLDSLTGLISPPITDNTVVVDTTP